MTANAERSIVETIGFEALPALDWAAVASRNADLLALGRAVFDIDGVPVVFSRQATAAQGGARPGVWLLLEWGGEPCVVGVSTALAGVIAQLLVDQTPAQLGEAGLDLLGHARLAPLLPAGLSLRQLALSQNGLSESSSAPDCQGFWVGRHLATGEPSGHELEIWAAAGFALASLVRGLARLANTHLPSPLATMPIALPLVAAKWHAPAGIFTDLAVGDVLFLG